MKYDNLMNGKEPKFQFKLEYTGINENLITDSSLSIITDKFDDIVGALVISKEKQGIRHFKKLYKLSKRQLEIILLSIEGHSNTDIGERLNIARRTVETHFFNIYLKLDIKNKTELIRLTNKFDM